MIIGGLAVIALGIPRLTVDVDATVAAAHLSPERLAEALSRQGIQPRIDYAGVSIRIPRPEDLLIYKLIASWPRDVEDAEGLLVLHGATMNLGRVRDVVHGFARALDDVERPQTLERLIRKTGLKT